ncbi:MAG: hypothetical protein H6964_14215 [Chromatiaceae bacterium]|nr:hypothetical protein [Gammaproteobacteria bacterium]MCB1878919.1 hypothetical protein [Gammaproteobacteria bacterium]MCP5448133.1 hypothetical protein [Chromatiaceae bacterium]
MHLKQLLFPAESRFLPGQRWVNILLRTLHLIGIAGLGGGFFYPSEGDLWRRFFDLTLWSGIGLAAIAIWNNGIWLIQLRGQAILLKLILLGLMPLFPAVRLPLLLAILIISGVISHAPASVRYYSLFHRRRIDLE